jgi:predicted O-methyltransferase YrrM
MNFTADWFTHNIPNFEKCMNALDKREIFLEIGSYEGRSTCWLLEHGLADDGDIQCIDPFVGMRDVEERFLSNVNQVKKPDQYFEHFRNYSYHSLSWLIQDAPDDPAQFDFIYIDGDHDPATTLIDASMAWVLLRKGGVMLFDDYEYPEQPTKCGIDGFLMGFVDKYDLLLKNYQLAVVKK